MTEDSKAASQTPQLRYPPRTVAEALAAPRRSVRVEEGQTLEVGPNAAEATGFHLVHVRSYEDLQALELMPKGLEEASVREAIAADDADARAFAREMLRTGSGPAHACSCEDGHEAGPSAPATLRGAYTRVRGLHHPALADLLSKHYEQPIAFDDVLPRMMRGTLERLLIPTMPRFVGVWATEDVDVQPHATLPIATGVSLWTARHITVGREGRIDFQGNSVSVRATSLTGPGAEIHLSSIFLRAILAKVNRISEGGGE
jgi:hypothetical protein